MDRNLFAENYENIRSCYTLGNNSMNALCALVATQRGKSIGREEFRACRKIISAGSNVLSGYRSTLEPAIAIKLALSDNPEEYFERLKEVDKCVNGKVLQDTERLLASLTILDNCKDGDWSSLYDRTMEVYGIMKKNHPVITTHGDMGFAALIAGMEGDVDSIMEDAERCFELLKGKVNFLSDGRQTVSHVLSMNRGLPEEKVERFLEIFNAFIKKGYKLHGDGAPVAAMLLNCNLPAEEIIAQARDYESFLRKQKGMGSLSVGTEEIRMLAVAMTVIDNTGDYAALDVTTNGIVTMILNMEMMIMMTSIAAASAAASACH